MIKNITKKRTCSVNMTGNKVNSESGNPRWQPYATSTPLKIKLNQKQLSRQTDRQESPTKSVNPSDGIINALLNNIQKDVSQSVDSKDAAKNKLKRKNRASIYFDVSSSSDEDEENCSEVSKKLQLKVNPLSRKKNKELEKSEVLENSLKRSVKTNVKSVQNQTKRGEVLKEIEINHKSSPDSNLRGKVSASSKRKRKVTTEKEIKSDEKLLDKSSSVHSVSVNKSKVTDKSLERRKSIDEIGNGQKTLETYFSKVKTKLEGSQIETGDKQIGTNAIEQEECQKTKATVNEVPNNADKPPMKDSVKQDVNNDMKIFNSPYSRKRTCATGKVASKSNKTEPVQSKKIKINKKSKSKHEKVTSCANNLSDLSGKKNLSHQLFSDTREQELLNSLDLTKLDTSDKQNNPKLPPKETQLVEGNSRVGLDKTCNDKTSKTDDQGLKSEDPKVNPSMGKEECSDSKAGHSEAVLSSDAAASEKDVKANGKVAKDSTFKVTKASSKRLTKSKIPRSKKTVLKDCKNPKSKECPKPKECPMPEECPKPKDCPIPEECQKPKECPNPKFVEEEKAAAAVNDNEVAMDDKQESKERETKAKAATGKGQKPIKPVNEESDQVVSSSSTPSLPEVFKSIGSLSSKLEFKPGCFAADCWSLKNFKCGVLQLTAKKQHSSRTMYENSYFGGIVLKGKLTMTIGASKRELKVGDMAFVPPLTDWVVANGHETEGVMYYWCGRFKSL